MGEKSPISQAKELQIVNVDTLISRRVAKTLTVHSDFFL